MATKKARSTGTKKPLILSSLRKKKPARKKISPSQRPPMLKEPIAARVMQAVILMVAVLLLVSALLSPSVGPIIVGVLVLLTGFPPIRGLVDEWLTGQRRGKQAERAAAIRMMAGAAVILFTLLNAVARIGG